MDFINSKILNSIMNKKISKKNARIQYEELIVTNYDEALEYVKSPSLGDTFHSVKPDLYCTFPLLSDDSAIPFITQYSKKNHKSHASGTNTLPIDSVVTLVPSNDSPYISSICSPNLNAHFFEDSENNPSFLIHLTKTSDNMRSLQPLFPESFKETYAIFLSSVSHQTKNLQLVDVVHSSFKPYVSEFIFHLYLTSPLYEFVFNNENLYANNKIPGFAYNESRLEVSRLFCFLLPSSTNDPINMSLPSSSFKKFMDPFINQYLCYIFTKHVIYLKTIKFSIDVFDHRSSVQVKHVCMIPICLIAMFFGRKIRSDFITLLGRFYNKNIFISDPDYLGTDLCHAIFLINVIHGNVTILGNVIIENPFKFPPRFLKLAAIMLRSIYTSQVTLHDFLYHLHLLFDTIPIDDSISLPCIEELHPYLVSAYGSLPDFMNSFPNRYESVSPVPDNVLTPDNFLTPSPNKVPINNSSSSFNTKSN